MMAFQMIWFMKMNLDASLPYNFHHAPALALAAGAIPLIDTLRVFTLRLARGKKPFKPDKSHVHHYMLNFFPKHIHATMILIGMDMMIIALAVFLDHSWLSVNYHFLIILLTGIACTTLPGVILYLWRRRGRGRPVTPAGKYADISIVKYDLKITWSGEPCRKLFTYPDDEIKKKQAQ